MKSINTTKQPNKFRFKLIKLKNLRNSCMHLFMPPDDEELHKALADTLELMYIIYLENNLHKTIESKLTPEESNLLDSLIDTEAAKLNEAYQKVERYKKERQKYHHKSYNPYAAPVFECPMCMNETLIQPQTKDYLFICTNCEHEEKAGSCSVSATCPGSYMPIPQCYLSDWNEDSMICEECLNYINNL